MVGEGYRRDWWLGKGGKEGGLSWSNFLYPCYLDHSSLLSREAFFLLDGGGMRWRRRFFVYFDLVFEMVS